MRYKALETTALENFRDTWFTFSFHPELSYRGDENIHQYVAPSFGLPWWLRWWRICPRSRRPGFSPWIRKILWRREWLSSSGFLPGEFRGKRRLVGYSPWGLKESDTSEWLTDVVPSDASNKLTSQFSSLIMQWLSLLPELPLCNHVKFRHIPLH